MRSSCFSSDPARNGRVRTLAQVESLDSLLFQQFATCFLISSQHLFSSSSLQRVFKSSLFSQHSLQHKSHLFSSSNRKDLSLSTFHQFEIWRVRFGVSQIGLWRTLYLKWDNHSRISLTSWQDNKGFFLHLRQCAFLECHLNAGLVHHYTLSVHQAFLRIPCTSFHLIPPTLPLLQKGLINLVLEEHLSTSLLRILPVWVVQHFFPSSSIVLRWDWMGLHKILFSTFSNFSGGNTTRQAPAWR